MSSKRRSTRSNNATNLHGQQALETTLKRQAAAARTSALALKHDVLSEQLCSRIYDIYDKYLEQGTKLSLRNEDGATAAGGRAQRRVRQSAGAPAEVTGAGADGESGGDGPSEALAAAKSAAAVGLWEQYGQQCMDLLEPLVAGNVTLPKHVQEVLMHFVLNAEAHPGSLSGRALGLLFRLLDAHPPAKETDDGILENKDLWEPVSCSWSARQHRDITRLTQLRQARGLSTLVASAHNLAARAVAPVHEIPTVEAPEAGRSGDVGQVLLLNYWIKLLQADLDVRLAAVRRRGHDPAWRRHLEDSLVVRIMMTYTRWVAGQHSKPAVVRQLAATVVFAHKAAAKGAPLVSGSGGGAAGGAPGCTHLLCGPAEVGRLAATLLGMFNDAYETLNQMGAYKRRGTITPENDMVCMDQALSKSVLKDLQYKDADLLQVLLASLRPAATVRLLVFIFADAAARQIGLGDLLAGGLREVHDFYGGQPFDRPPRVRAADVLEYLLGGSANRTWAAATIRFNDLPARVGLALLVTALVTAALQQAQAEQAQVQQAQQGGGQAASGVAEDADMEEGVGGGTVAWWAEEAARVAQLYRRAAECLQDEGLGLGEEAGGPAAAGLGLGLLVARRCADRLAGRALAGQPESVMTA